MDRKSQSEGELVETLNELTIVELSEFKKLFEETFEITAAAVSVAKDEASVSSGGESVASLEQASDKVELLHDLLERLRKFQTAHGGRSQDTVPDRLVLAAINMERSIDALGPVLANVETPVSPQLARSLQATENVWRDMQEEFGLLSSREVSELVGSRSPNRSYASDQRSKGKLLAIKRPGGLRYPGFQFDPRLHVIRPVMEELIKVAAEADNSEADLALWLYIPTGYLDGDRPVDRLDDTETVVDAARQSFNVEW
jgi:hypothetical protein